MASKSDAAREKTGDAVTPQPKHDRERAAEYGLDGIGELVFLDRYAIKDGTKDVQPGDVVVTLVKDDPRWPQREVGTVLAVHGERVTIRLKSTGEEIVRERKELDKPLETTPAQMWDRMAGAIVEIEAPETRAALQKEFRWLLDGFRFSPGGRINAMLGTGAQLTAYNCFSGDTIVITEDGPKPIKDLNGKVRVVSQDGIVREAEFRLYGVNRLSRIELENGQVIHATANHRWPYLTEKGDVKWTTTRELVGKRLIQTRVGRPFNQGEVEAGVQHGTVYGDGTLPRRSNRGWDSSAKSLAELFGPSAQLVGHFESYSDWGPKSEPTCVIVDGLPADFKQMPPEDACPSYWYGFFLGFLSADGDVDDRGSTMIAQREREPLEILARQLNKVGIATMPIARRDRKHPFNGEAYHYHILRIPKHALRPEDFIRDDHRISFVTNPPREQRSTVEVVSVESTDRVEPVYCCEEPQTHSFVIEGGLWTGNCYVIPLRGNDPVSGADSRQAIMDTLGNMVEIMSRGGGVGINLSTLRPRLSHVSGVSGRSSGSVSWGGLFSFATGLVEQGGSRRGALMLILNDWHPDLLDFIQAKRDMRAITNANISVGVSNGFMKAVEEDLEWELIFPDTQDPEYDALWDGNIQRWRDELKKPVKVYKRMRARDIWNTIIESAWMSAEPGVVFLERMNEYSNAWYFEDLICTNPCGEQPLPGWGVCNLGHVNLSRFVTGPIGEAEVQWDDLRRATRLGVRFLDNIVDITPYFFSENERVQKAERRVGMGTLGLGEMLVRLGLRYGSEESLKFIDKLYEFIAVEAYLASAELAQEKGAFPEFDAEKYLQSGFMRGMPERVRQAVARLGSRNVCVLTQAPTGSTGTMIGTSTGIEPYYSWTYWRQSRLGLKEVSERIVDEWFTAHPELEPKLEDLPPYFVTAMELAPQDHIRVQAAIQRWTDSSISKTANAPNQYTVEQTRELYEYAYKLGCKGVTIYRDGSRDQQVLTAKEDEKEKSTNGAAPHEPVGAEDAGNGASPAENGVESPAPSSSAALSIEKPGEAGAAAVVRPNGRKQKRPMKLTGVTYEYETPLGTAFITINDLEGQPYEVFVTIGKAGSDVAAASEAIGRLTTLFLRYGDLGGAEEKVAMLVKHLRHIGGLSSVGFGPNRVTSVPDAVAKALTQHLEERLGDKGRIRQVTSKGLDLCPSCGLAALAREEGCFVCKSCGYTKC